MSFMILCMFLNPVHFWSILVDIVTSAGVEEETRSFEWMAVEGGSGLLWIRRNRSSVVC